MSSHHFVKEGQEPALLILDAISFELVSPLLEWAPMVMVSENVLEDVLSWGIKIDVVLTAGDQVEVLRQKMEAQAPVNIVPFSSDELLISDALHFLESSKQSAVNIIAKSVEAIISVENAKSSLQVNIIDETNKWSAITAGVFEKWVPSGTKLGVRKTSEGQGFHTQALNSGEHGFVAADDAVIAIRSDNLFWVSEPH